MGLQLGRQGRAEWCLGRAVRRSNSRHPILQRQDASRARIRQNAKPLSKTTRPVQENNPLRLHRENGQTRRRLPTPFRDRPDSVESACQLRGAHSPRPAWPLFLAAVTAAARISANSFLQKANAAEETSTPGRGRLARHAVRGGERFIGPDLAPGAERFIQKLERNCTRLQVDRPVRWHARCPASSLVPGSPGETEDECSHDNQQGNQSKNHLPKGLAPVPTAMMRR